MHSKEERQEIAKEDSDKKEQILLIEEGVVNEDVDTKTDFSKNSFSEKLPYIEVKRGFGAGELRLAKSLEF